MATELIIQGGSIELHESESFNKARHRLNKAKKLLIDYENGNIDGHSKGQEFQPYHLLSFRSAPVDDDDEEGGRVSIDPSKVIGISSTEPKDISGSEEED